MSSKMLLRASRISISVPTSCRKGHVLYDCAVSIAGENFAYETSTLNLTRIVSSNNGTLGLQHEQCQVRARSCRPWLIPVAPRLHNIEDRGQISENGAYLPA